MTSSAENIEKTKTAIHATYFSIVGNFFLSIIKILSGIWGNSYALIADGIESIADIFSSFVVLLGIRYAHRPADKSHPYGHGKAEPLITFLVVGLLISSAIMIVHESIQNIQTPHELPKSWTLFVLVPLIVWKEWSFQLVMRKAKKINSTVLKADAWHHRSDAITSLAALIGISVALLFGKGYETADDWAALVASAFILFNAYTIFRPALGEMMDEHLYDDLLEKIREISITVPGIEDTEKCFIRKAGMVYHVDLHAKVLAHLSVKEGHDIAHQLKDTLRNALPELGHVLIHIEPA